MKIRRIKCLLCPYKDVCIPEQESKLTKLKELENKNEEMNKQLTEINERLTTIIKRYETIIKLRNGTKL